MNVAAIIPARGGSKGLPRKNIKLLCGRPLIAWSIEAAKQSKHVTAVYVSTEDAEIAAVARRNGAEVIDRPQILATDTATTDGVLVHAMQQLPLVELCVLLQPTVPIRPPGLIDAVIERLLDNDADCCFTANRLHFVWWRCDHGEWAHEADWRTNSRSRPMRQDMRREEVYWHEDGSVYVTRAGVIRVHRKRICGRIQIHPAERTVDIDTLEDWAIAEALMVARLEKA